MTEVAEQPRTRSASTSAEASARPAEVLRARDQFSIADRFSIADSTLDVLEQRRLSPAELRILLALSEGDVELDELARSSERRPIEIRRAAARLYARGLLRWRFLPRPGTKRKKKQVLGITGTGRSVIRPLGAYENL
jgi:hypothetical protein